MMKKILLLALVCMMALGSVALATATDEDVARLLTIEPGTFEEPILLTSVGQSADVNIVNTLLTKAGMSDVRLATTAAADEVANYKTLVLAIGGSSKGLGAAGINETEELARVQAVIAAAQENGVKILTLHVGGQARRGVLSDMFIPDAVKAANAMIVVKSGDAFESLKISDMLFENEIPAAYVDNTAGVVEPLTALFAK